MGEDWRYFMLHTKAGTAKKLRRFSDSEWRAYVGGILALASESPVKGVLLLDEGVPVEAEDIAGQAGVNAKVARATLEKAIKLKLLVPDAELGALEVRDWYEHNPAPRNDPTAAERMRRYREKRNALRNADRNGDVTLRANARSDSGSGSSSISSTAVVARARELSPELVNAIQAAWEQYPPRRRNLSDMQLADALERLGALDAETVARVHAAIIADKASDDWQREDGRYILNLDDWIAQRRWVRSESATGLTQEPDTEASIAKLREHLGEERCDWLEQFEVLGRDGQTLVCATDERTAGWLDPRYGSAICKAFGADALRLVVREVAAA